MASLGKMMKFTRYWLKEHGLRADGFFPEIYYNHLPKQSHAYMEMWIPFKEREINN
jgi:AraC family transcriptional regulator